MVPSTMLNPMSTTIFQFSTNSTDVIISPWCPVSWVHLHHSSAFWPWSGVVSLLTSFLFGTFSTQIPYSGLQIAASHSGKENQIKSGFFCVCVFVCFSWNLVISSLLPVFWTLTQSLCHCLWDYISSIFLLSFSPQYPIPTFPFSQFLQCYGLLALPYAC